MSAPFLQLIYVVPLAHWPVPFVRLLQFLVPLKALSNALSLTDQVHWPIALHSIGLVRTDSGHAPAVSRRFTSFLQFLVLLKALSHALSLTDQVHWPIALHSIGRVRTDSGHAPAVSRRFTSFLQFLVLLKALSHALSLTDQVHWPIALHSIGRVRTDSGHAPAVSRRFTSFHAQGCLMSVVSMLFPCRFFVFGVSDVFEISQGCVKHHDSMSWCTNTKTKGVERERHDFITKINGFDTVYHMYIYIYIYICT